MNRFSTWSEFSSVVLDASILLIGKWTGVLALAWLAHGILAGRNPRWRVALWRSAIVGLVLVAVLSSAPPIVAYRFVPRDQPSVDYAQTVPTAPAFEGHGAPAIILRREPAAPIPLMPAVASSVVTVSRDDPAPAPPSAEAQGIRWGARLVWWLWSIWMAGVLVLTVRLIVGSLGLARVIRRSSPVPDGIVGECWTIAERLGCHRAVRVRRTSDVATPCLAGLWRPVLLLPERECEAVRPDDLRAILAHELAHARNHDLAWNRAAHVASILLWFHPLAWRIRAAHAAACDAVCDAVAADLLGDVASYSRALARLAVRAAWPSPVHGLAMARTSDVRRRLDALNRKLFRTPLSWRCVMPALFVASVILVLIGGFGFTRGEQAKASPTPKPADEKAAGKLTLRAVTAETHEPIEDVSIEYWGRFGEQRQQATVMTGDDGTAVIEWPVGATIHRLGITARKPNLVPIFILWNDERHPVELPAVKELRFAPGTTIGGIVHDESGRPVEGVTVDVSAPATEYDGGNFYFRLGTPRTDAQGRWRLDVAPKDLAGVWGRTSHPHYRSSDVVASRKLDGVVVLKKGLTVVGRVVDAAGRPVRGARAILGHVIWGTNAPTASTNERGAFTLENCDRGPSIITVQAEGFAPRIQDVRIEDRTADVEFRMTEPGSVLRGRVVDVQDKPVAGAFFAADTWRGHRSIQFRVDTDKDGRVEWKSAPRDVVLYDIVKEDYMASRHVPLTASEREQTVILYPKLVITGRVTDAESGRPVPKFRVVKGWQSEWQFAIHWSENMGLDVTDGQYTVPFDQPREALFVKIEAPGYQMAVSRAFQPKEGRQTLDFKLRRAAGISGIVLLPNGKPAEGVKLALSTREHKARLRAGQFDIIADFPKTMTDSDGRFSFPPRANKFVLIAVSDAGYAEASSDEFAKSGKLVLRAWGRLEGGVRIGARVGANVQVVFDPIRPEDETGIGGYEYGYQTSTDERGRFRFDRVAPGPGIMARVVEKRFPGRPFRQLPCWQEHIEIKPEQTVQVTLGGKGRPVIGRFVLDGTPELPVDWAQNEELKLGVPPEKSDPGRFGILQFGPLLFATHVEKDGRFRIDDVPSGQYELELAVNGGTDPSFPGPGRDVARMKMSVVMPEMPGGRSNEPLDLGTIVVKLFETIQIGDLAPDFDVAKIAGKDKGQRLRLSDYRGKLVLLSFWEPWRRQIDMTVLKEVQETFGSDPRFVLISLACGKDIGQAEKSIKENGLGGTHGFAGDFVSVAATRYKIPAMPNAYKIGPDEKGQLIPVTFLIGPDGRIVAHDLGGDDREAVRKALENPKLFPAAARTAPSPHSP